MGASVGEIQVDLVANTKSFKTDISNVESMIGQTGKRIAKTVAAAFTVKEIFDFSKECLELGSDLAEVQNVVDVTFPKMAKRIDEFAKSAAGNFGLSETMAKQYAGTFGSMAEAFGFTEKQAYDMGTTLTGLAGDVASFYNLSQDLAYTKLKSVFSGETETLKDLGIVMTQSALDAYALANGFGKTTAKMTEMEKVALRYQFVQDQLKNSAGDFLRTADSWANQTRYLSLQVDSLKASIGQGLIAAFTPVIRVVNQLIAKVGVLAQTFSDLMTGLFGGSEGANAQANSLQGVADAADQAANSVTNQANATKKAVKEAVRSQMSFDRINKLSEKSTSGDSTGGSGEGKAAKGNTNNEIKEGAVKKVNDAVDKLKNKLKKAWSTGDFSELGSKFAAGLNIGLQKIKWDKIKKTLKNIAKSTATFLNGFVKTADWNLIGKTIAEGLNTALDVAYTFLSTFDMLQFGKSIGVGLNSAVEKFDSKLLGRTLAARLRNSIQFAFGIVGEFDFKSLGKKISDGINSFFAEMGKVDGRTGLTGWQELGETIGNSIKGITTTINTALDNTDWNSVGRAVSQLFTSIDWWGIMGNLLEVLSKTFSGIIKASLIAFADNPVGMVKALTGAFALVFTVNKLMKGSLFLKDRLSTVFSNILNFSLTKVEIKGKSISSLVSSLPTKLKSSITTVASSIAQNFLLAFDRAGIGAGLQAALATNIGFLGIGVAGVAAAGAGVAIGKIINNAIQEEIEANEYAVSVAHQIGKMGTEKIQTKIEGINKALEGSTKAVKDFNTSMKNAGTSESGKNIDDLADKYYKLSKKKNRSAAEDAVLKKYSEELLKIMPDLKDNIDSQTGAYKGSKKQLDGLVGSTQRAAKAQAAYNKVVALYEEQQDIGKTVKDAQKSYDEAYKNLIEQRSKLEEMKKTGISEDSHEYQKQVRILGEYGIAVNNAKESLNKAKKSQKDINRDIKKANNIMNNAKVSTSNYSKASDHLKKSLSNIGITGKSAKSIMKKLQKAVDDGEISWKDYKTITDKNYDSTSDLQKAIDRVKSKDVKLDVTTSGEDDVKNLKDSYDGLSNKEVKVSLDSTEASKKIDELTGNKTTNITVKTDDTSVNKLSNFKIKKVSLENEAFSTMQKSANNKLKLNPKIADVNIDKRAKEKVKSLLTGNVFGVSQIKVKKPDNLKKFEATFPWAKEISSNKYSPIQWLAQGGYVKANTPQLAMIGDNKRYGEIVAPENKMLEMAKKAAELSSEQSSMSQVVELLQQILAFLEKLQIHLFVDGEDLTKKIAKINKQLTRHSGKNMFEVR